MSNSAPAASPEAPGYLRVEYLTAPLGLGTTTPRFSWEVRDKRDGARQSAYEIEVTRDGAKVWDTGKVASSETAHVVYKGEALKSFDRLMWKVRTWDGVDAASPWASAEFGIGPLKNSDWKAQWLTDPTPVPPVQKAHNGFHTQQTADQNETKWVQIDLGKSTKITSVELYPTRPHDWTKDGPGFEFPTRFVIQAGEKGDGTDPVVWEETSDDFPNPGTALVRFNTPANARFVRLVVSKLTEGDPGKFGFTLAEMQVLDGEKVLSKGKDVSASDTLNSGDWHLNNLVNGDLTSHKAGGEEALPPFNVSKQFEVKKKVKRATLYATALGAYETVVRRHEDHGTSAGAVPVFTSENILAPEWTDYFERVQYQAFDLTEALSKDGKYEIRALVGDGWYAGRIGMSQALHPERRVRGVYGRRPEFAAMLRVEYTDGTKEVVGTDSDWRGARSAEIKSSDIYDGEAQLRLNPSNAGSMTQLFATKARAMTSPDVVAQRNEPIRQTDQLKPVSMTQPKPGVYVFDMGQNMVGKIDAHFEAKNGAIARFQYAEMLDDDGTVYTANLRGAPQVDTVEMQGSGTGILRTHFTYHGFRYVEVTGVEKIEKDDVVGVVFHSDSPIVGSFTSSSPLLDKIWQNVLWTQKANLMSSPTDCPQRDERLGWMGDILVFGQAAAYNMDMAGFYTKWLQDVRDAQADDGRLPDIAPHPYGINQHFTGAPGWGDAGVVVPWRAYENYGDTEILKDSFESCRRWVDFIDSNNPDHVWRNKRGNDYNDWLNGDTLIAEGWPTTGGSVPHDVFATIMFYNSTNMTAKMAKVIGKTAEAEKYGKLAADIKTAFVKNFLGEGGVITGDTQAGYSLALFYDIVPEPMIDMVFAKMVKALEKYHGKMSTGFHSSHALMLELSKHGRSDLAYKLAMSTEFPSWGYSVEQGSTTIWERWDGYVKGRGFQDPGMNSFNHWAFGAVTEWIMKVVAGIQPGVDGQDWKDFVIQPMPGGGLTHARGTYRSLYGEIVSDWKIEGGKFKLDVVVPPNTTATVGLPDGTIHEVKAGSHSFVSEMN
jgi:alpha-L-rhamnosidase